MVAATSGRTRWRGLAALSFALAMATATAAVAHAALIVGVNDAAGLDPTQVGWFYPTAAAEGLEVSTIPLRWDDGAPTTVPDVPQVQRAIAVAAANGVSVDLDLFPLHSQVFTGAQRCPASSDPQACGNSAELAAFATWTAQVAQTFPSVHSFVVMNECNQPLFINPQWNSAGQNQSAEICGRALAGAYDALKAVDPADVVWGVGLSPRGNDNPNAASNASTSPVAFLEDLGSWFRAFVAATGRTTPLMDGLDFHPYPIPQSQPFSQGYQDPNDASIANLPRIYQAFYTGFNGTPQPTIGQQPGGGLPLSLNEVGIQTATNGHPGYVGSEVSANANGGVVGAYATESYQATWYVEMLSLVACDPNVRLVNIYHLVDEADLAGWQSGLYYLDHTPKQAAAAVHDWIASSAGTCQGPLRPWTPLGVEPAPSIPPVAQPQSPARILAASDGRVRIFDAVSHRLRRVLAPFGAAYTGPLSVALGGTSAAPLIAVGEGQGGAPLVVLLNGRTDARLASIEPFPATFSGGLSVAFGHLQGGASDDLVVGSGSGMPAQVKVYALPGLALLEQLTPFGAAFRGGVSVAAGALSGSGGDDLVVGSGAGMRSQVAVYAGLSPTPLEQLRPFAASFTGGVSVAAGSLGSGVEGIVVGSGAGRAAVIKAYDATGSHVVWAVDVFAQSFVGGVNVADVALPAPGGPIVVAGSGVGGGAQVRLLNAADGSFATVFLAASGSDALALAAG